MHCGTFIYSYIHTSLFLEHNTTGTIWSELCVCVCETDCLFAHRVVCLRWSGSFLLSGKKSRQTLSQSAHFHAELKLHRNKKKKCFASSGGKTCFCGVTKYLNVISVLHRQTHSAACYLEKTFLCRCWQKLSPVRKKLLVFFVRG